MGEGFVAGEEEFGIDRAEPIFGRLEDEGGVPTVVVEGDVAAGCFEPPIKGSLRGTDMFAFFPLTHPAL